MENFDRPESLVAVANFSGNPADASWTTDFVPNHARIENGQLVLSMRRSDEVNKYGRRPGFGATVSSTRWMLYGTVSARIRTGSSRQGVVSSFIFRNHMTGDEIDYEWVGKAPKEVQSNYYWHTPSHMDPKDIDYSNQRKTALPNDLSQEYHVYTIEWLPDRMSWYIDGNLVRTVLRTEVKNDRYPSSPCQIQFSIWDGGSDDPQIAEWAGGPPSWGDENSNPGSGSSPAVYEVFVDYVDIRCHTPLDPLAAAWPPKDQGFQGFVNPFAPNATGDALVIGDGAPAVSTLDRGGFHWPVPGERAVYAQPGRHLNQQQQQQQQHHQRKPSSSTSKFARLRESIGM
ncbi:hypothetical protein BGW41_002751 [Actinomortierella wolfii]|nr:hypothetical protein BGW41_002751 [Actinomortierella wolfii]